MYSISNQIEGLLTREHNRGARKLSVGIYHASDASAEAGNLVRGACLRELWYRYMGFHGTPHELESITRMYQGTAWEEYLKSTLRANRMLVSPEKRPDLYEVEFTDPRGFTVIGHTDLVLRPYQAPTVVEVKSIGGYQTERSVFPTAKGATPVPLAHHTLQAFVYASLLPNDIDKVELLYVSRITGLLQSFTIGARKGSAREMTIDNIPSGIFLSDVVDRYARLHAHLTQDTLPPRDFVAIYSASQVTMLFENRVISKRKYGDYLAGRIPIVSDPACNYCQFHETCLRNKHRI